MFRVSVGLSEFCFKKMGGLPKFHSAHQQNAFSTIDREGRAANIFTGLWGGHLNDSKSTFLGVDLFPTLLKERSRIFPFRAHWTYSLFFKKH